MGGCLDPRGGYWAGALWACWMGGALMRRSIPVETTEGQILSSVEAGLSMTDMRIGIYAA